MMLTAVLVIMDVDMKSTHLRHLTMILDTHHLTLQILSVILPFLRLIKMQRLPVALLTLMVL